MTANAVNPEANCSSGVALLGTRPQGVHTRCLRVHGRTGRTCATGSGPRRRKTQRSEDRVKLVRWWSRRVAE